MHAKHDREKPVGEWHLCPVDTIQRARRSSVGQRRLRGLYEEGMGTTQQRAMQADALIHGLAQMGCTYALRATSSLYG
jgi:hypothetical protein